MGNDDADLLNVCSIQFKWVPIRCYSSFGLLICGLNYCMGGGGGCWDCGGLIGVKLCTCGVGGSRSNADDDIKYRY